MRPLSTLSFGAKMASGFAAITLVVGVVVVVMLYSLSNVGRDMSRVVDLRIPASEASARMVNNINASLADLRGYMLTGDAMFKDGRARDWDQIARDQLLIDGLSEGWTELDKIEQWQEFKATLAEFKVAQLRVEAVVGTVDEQPATKMLVEEAAPRGAVMFSEVTAMIDAEAKLPATPERKALLGMMADVRGTTGLSLANLRAFLLTGDEAFYDQFKTIWAENDRRFSDLSDQVHLLTPEQHTSFETLRSARNEFVSLPPQMYAIRSSAQWNVANYILVTEAVPRAGKLLDILSGPDRKAGDLTGGMVGNQADLLREDGAATARRISALQTLLWILLTLGGAATIAIVVFMTNPLSHRSSV